jgi:thiamine-monophosphate kinase
MSSEVEFVEQLRQQFPAVSPVRTGIGDDGAVLANPDGSETVVVTDMLLDGVHFEISTTSAQLAGRKAIAVNLSDLAAMGCRPTAAFVSIAVPKLTDSKQFLTDLYRGIHGLAEQYEFTVAGGDTNSWNGPFAINVCMTGEPFAEQSILRSGAEPGDTLLVTGPLGGSLASRRHLAFEPRLKESEWLVTNCDVHAMMDISDGLAIDLHRMMDASGTGATLKPTQIPVHPDVPPDLSAEDRLKAAFSDGEDFELLISMPPDSVPTAQRSMAAIGYHDLSVIGTVTEEGGCRTIDKSGNAHLLPPEGWQHD